MKLKLRLDLSASEIKALADHVYGRLTAVPLEQAKEQLGDYMALSNLFEVHAKLQKLATNNLLFPTRRTDETYALTITRSQALALAYVQEDGPPTGTAVVSFEEAFRTRLLAKIHQAFLV